MTVSHAPVGVVKRLGIDENGLGAQLGPLIVTAVLASVDDAGSRALTRKLGKRLAADLGDSKRLLSFGNHALGEAWARALFPTATSPEGLLDLVLREKPALLKRRCPEATMDQCWAAAESAFVAPDSEVRRLTAHLDRLAARGIRIETACAEVVCVQQLNTERENGANRFTSDLHAMERLTLHLRERADGEIFAICGKVGGMGDYSRFFGPLAGRLHVVLTQQRAHSGYRFPGLGELHFMQDADAKDPLVMLASLIGKYLREELMGRINRYYASHIADLKGCSGYNDPVTGRFIEDTAPVRRHLRIAQGCFGRAASTAL